MRKLALHFLVLLLASGCFSASPGLFTSPVETLSAGEDLARADQRFKDEQYKLALALYRQLLDTYPEGTERQRIYLQIARCYYNEQVQALHDAEEWYRRYLDEYPEGEYAEEALLGVERVRAIQANRAEDAQERFAQIEGDVLKLRAALDEHPYDADLHLSLGNALWELEQYEEAVDHYARSQKINAALKEYDLLQSRMIIDESGKPRPVTPEMARDMERERNPLVVFGLHEYKSRLERDLYSAREVRYNVQGMVRNQSSRTLQRVAVEVVFYNGAREQLDTKTVLVGDMPPGSVRAFGVQATTYDNIYNIASYECQAYER